MPHRIEDARRQLPATASLAYLNTGTAGPLPQAVAEAIEHWSRRQVEEGRSSFKMFMDDYFPLMDDLRARFARLLGAGPQEVALTHHTTEGMNIAVWGLRWQPGDELLTTNHEHEGGIIPAYTAANRFGLTVRVVDVGDGGEGFIERVAAALSPRTRLLVLSHVSYRTGAILPVKEVAGLAHQAGALVAVDGAQSAGALPIDVRALDVDFYAVPGQKWLLGPEGVGALYVRKERLSELLPTFVGFFSMQDFGSWDYTGNLFLATDARRYETSSVYWPGLFGMQAALDWFESELTYEWIYERGQAITARCRALLAKVPGASLLTPQDHANLTTFRIDGLEPMAASNALAERGVIIRWLDEPLALRASTGFFNREQDLALLAAELGALLGTR